MAQSPAATEPAPQTHKVSVELPNAKDMLIIPALTRLLAVKMIEVNAMRRSRKTVDSPHVEAIVDEAVKVSPRPTPAINEQTRIMVSIALEGITNAINPSPRSTLPPA